MKYVNLPTCEQQKLPFYLAMEEYVAKHIDEDELFFMWQVPPTVIFGRNQLINNEVNVEYCQSCGIEMYRRKSGGGCVYADFDNIMFSYISKSVDVTSTFSKYTNRVAEMLRTLNLDASATSRNDVYVGGKKVSGNAFYHIPGRSIVHGTMLFNTNLENMTRAITPSIAKLEAKGVSSVRNHITVLNDHLSMSIEQFKQYAKSFLCDGKIILNSADVDCIKEIEAVYYSKEWIYGNNPQSTFTNHERIEGAGEFFVSVEAKGNKIRKIDIRGDYFLLSDIDSGLFDRLIGVDYDANAVAERLRGFDTSKIIMNLTTKQFINLLF